MNDNPNSLVREILVAVTALPGSMFWRENTGVAVTAQRNVVRFGLRGTPDILGLLQGRAVAIEAKTGAGRLSKDQKLWRDAWVRCGGIFIEARSVDQTLRELLF